MITWNEDSDSFYALTWLATLDVAPDLHEYRVRICLRGGHKIHESRIEAPTGLAAQRRAAEIYAELLRAELARVEGQHG